jgi:hypothetical protein
LTSPRELLLTAGEELEGIDLDLALGKGRLAAKDEFVQFLYGERVQLVDTRFAGHFGKVVERWHPSRLAAARAPRSAPVTTITPVTMITPITMITRLCRVASGITPRAAQAVECRDGDS